MNEKCQKNRNFFRKKDKKKFYDKNVCKYLTRMIIKNLTGWNSRYKEKIFLLCNNSQDTYDEMILFFNKK